MGTRHPVNHVVMASASKKPIFRSLDARESDTGDLEVSEVESLCMSCEEMGVTRLLLTRIPLFREVIVSSFSCPHCHASNSEIQPGTTIQDQGVRWTLRVSDTEYLNRLVVKADTAMVCIPELDFEITPNTQKGAVTTVESILSQSVSGLEEGQPGRRATHPELANKLDDFISKLRNCLIVKVPFTVILDDPTGNSFVENRLAPEPDPHLSCEHYKRTEEQNIAIGLIPASEEQSGSAGDEGKEETRDAGDETAGAGSEDSALVSSEVMAFQTNCSHCQSPTETRMKTVDIPYFKQVIIMATSCEYCGFHSNEVKSGSGVSAKGIRITLHLTCLEDLNRDMLKAETSSLFIPELEFELHSGTLGGRFTTVEGLLRNALDQLKESNPLGYGDSATYSKLHNFIDRLAEVAEGQHLNVHIILDDPAGNSYIQDLCTPNPDPNLTVEYYERSFEQNDDLGLNDMKTENYT